jgi:hypothetical protein
VIVRLRDVSSFLRAIRPRHWLSRTGHAHDRLSRTSVQLTVRTSSVILLSTRKRGRVRLACNWRTCNWPTWFAPQHAWTKHDVCRANPYTKVINVQYQLPECNVHSVCVPLLQPLRREVEASVTTPLAKKGTTLPINDRTAELHVGGSSTRVGV